VPGPVILINIILWVIKQEFKTSENIDVTSVTQAIPLSKLPVWEWSPLWLAAWPCSHVTASLACLVARKSSIKQYRRLVLLPLLFFFLSSLCLWLRSSVVSVLFSLISERLSLTITLIIPIFVPREVASGLAHVPPHRVSGITLPPDDATPFSSVFRFHCMPCLRGCEEDVTWSDEKRPAYVGCALTCVIANR